MHQHWTNTNPESKVVDQGVLYLGGVVMSKSCKVCGEPVEGFTSKMVFNVKCDKCRKTPSSAKKTWMDTETQVSCRVCGVLRRRLGDHLLADHQLSADAYKAQFPDAAVDAVGTRKRSDECRMKMAEAARQRWASKEARKAQSDRLKESAPWKGITLSEDHRKAISDGGLGVKHELTDDGKKVIGDRGREVLVELRQRLGYHDRQSKAIKQRALNEGDRFGLRRPEAQRKSLDSRIMNGTLIPIGGGRGVTGFREGIPHYCRSTLEANFARILIHEGIIYEYEPQLFMLPSGARWTPDFRLTQSLLGLVPAGWVELKGWRMKDGTFANMASAKMEAFEKLTKELVFVLCQAEALWDLLETMYSDVVLWERPGYNMKTHPQVFGRRAA